VDSSPTRSSSRHRRHVSAPAESGWKLYYELTKPGIVYSNVMTGASGYLLASKFHVRVSHFLGLLVGMGLLIAAACVLNNYLDRGLDVKMERTKGRALVSGNISVKNALTYAMILLILGFLALTQTNKLTMFIGLMAVIFYVIIYGYFKRHSVYGTLVGTIPGGASLVAGYCAYTDKFGFAPVLLLVLMVCWQMSHFYSIAIYRLRDYKEAGLPLWPIKRGIKSTTKQIKLFMIGFIVAAFLLTIFGYAGYSFLAVMVIVTAYWLHLAYKATDSTNQEAWAKKLFLHSLIVVMALSVMLPVSRIIP
jgi:protoheme IX farnesyltransferase